MTSYLRMYSLSAAHTEAALSMAAMAFVLIFSGVALADFQGLPFADRAFAALSTKPLAIALGLFLVVLHWRLAKAYLRRDSSANGSTTRRVGAWPSTIYIAIAVGLCIYVSKSIV